jgi:hypothetical protein
LREIDARCRVVRAADRFAFDDDDRFSLRPGALEDWQKLIDACTDSPPERIVYLWSLDAQVDDMAVNLDALLHLTQVLESAQPARKLRLDLVTRNAQAAGSDPQPTSVAQAPAIGLIRVILNEHSNLCWRAIDLPVGRSLADTSLEGTFAQRPGTRDHCAAARLIRRPTAVACHASNGSIRLPFVGIAKELRPSRHLHFAPFELPQWTGSGIIEVKRRGMISATCSRRSRSIRVTL